MDENFIELGLTALDGLAEKYYDKFHGRIHRPRLRSKSKNRSLSGSKPSSPTRSRHEHSDSDYERRTSRSRRSRSRSRSLSHTRRTSRTYSVSPSPDRERERYRPRVVERDASLDPPLRHDPRVYAFADRDLRPRAESPPRFERPVRTRRIRARTPEGRYVPPVLFPAGGVPEGPVRYTFAGREEGWDRPRELPVYRPGRERERSLSWGRGRGRSPPGRGRSRSWSDEEDEGGRKGKAGSLGASLAGAVAGGWLGKRAGKGVAGAVVGAVAGAVGAGLVDGELNRRKREREAGW
ncbi:hypothetical protein EJ06DRAFT_553126 [Trichodelitschia bisporula]|uniref:Glycine zipper domain-containing protein n=1 Tax=Trichodelitschia bisporula TaxID=703511 RepID=A0A6G1I7N0_9PEZI|nr:hypothetical protein EJ06DRAFT_553126 [Trichodelitschia bisporula]